MLQPKRRRGAEDQAAGVDINAPKTGIVEKTNIVTNPNRTTVIDTERLQAEFLLKYAEGAPLVVTWYRNLKGINDLKSFFDLEVDNPTQQLEVIYNLPLQVTSAISPSQQTDNKSFTAQGEATLPLSFPANEHDFFVTSISNDRLGLFYVTETQRGSFDKEGLLRVEYTLVSEFGDTHKTACVRSTVREYYYASDRVGLGHTPLLTPSEWGRWRTLNELVDEIKDVYVNLFFEHNARTITLPNQQYKVYDPFLVSFVKRLGFSKFPYELTEYNLDPIKPSLIFTFWRELVEQSKRMRSRVSVNLSPYSTACFKRGIVYNTVYASHVDIVLMNPDSMRLDVPTSVQLTEDFTPEIYEGGVLALSQLPWFIPFTHKPYVVSERYYKGGYSSVMEYAMVQLIEKQPLDQSIAIELGNRVFDLPELEAAYYMPIIYTLLNYSRGLQ